MNEVIQTICDSIKSKNLILFCGAGISYNSGLPLVNQFQRYILEEIFKLPDEEVLAIINAKMPFEVFIDYLINGSDPTILLDVYGMGEPNPNHLLIAKLAAAGYLKIVITTNFDLLIEKALEREGLKRDKEYRVLYEENSFHQINWNEEKLQVIKIHGTVENKKDMAITLKAVANQTLSEPRKAVVEYCFSKGTHTKVLVLGYSCSDIFDISPLISAITDNPKEVIFVEHSHTNGNRERKNGEIEDISIKPDKNPFKKFKGSWRIFCNTDDLVIGIWNSLPFIKGQYEKPETKGSCIWEDIILDWAISNTLNYNGFPSNSILIPIFFNISQPFLVQKYKAVAAYQQWHLNSLGFDNVGKENQKERTNISRIPSKKNEFDQIRLAIQHFNKILKVARDKKDKKSEEIALNHLGELHIEILDCPTGLDYHFQALYIAKETGDLHGEFLHTSNIGIAYFKWKKYDKAIEYLNIALTIAQNIGDRKDEAYILVNMGNVYMSGNDDHNAIDCYEKAFKVADDIGHLEIKQSVNLVLSDLYHKIGKPEIAEKYLDNHFAHKGDLGLSELKLAIDMLKEFYKKI